jgi:hypothetical protein
MAAEVESWPDRFDPPLLVPLVRSGDETWQATARAKDDRRIALVYSRLLGLLFGPPTSHPRG